MKIEFIKETKMDGYNTYYTKAGGYYINNSLSLKENEARELFERIKKDGPLALENKIEVVESFEYKINEEK
jgi:hypothetical protein